MVHAIIRIEKVKTYTALVQREKHNERTKETPNADEARYHLNQEYVKEPGQSSVAALKARLREAGITKHRSDATLCVEVVLTGGPEAAIWQRAPATAPHKGDATDMRGSQWEADVVAFARREWGKNLVGLVLHQDEHTPHFHAFVAPVVGPGGGRSGELNPKKLDETLPETAPCRLSARDLFSPHRLALLQTDFADAVAAHGFERGIAGSRAHHKTMSQMYGLLEKTATEIAPSVGAVRAERFVLDTPPIFKREEWRAETENNINAELDRRLAEANAKLELAGQLVVAAAGGNEAAGRSRAWVASEKDHGDMLGVEMLKLRREMQDKEALIKDLHQTAAGAEADAVKLAAQHEARWDKLALHAAQGTLPDDFQQRGQQLWETEREAAKRMLEKALAAPLPNEAEFFKRVRWAGYDWEPTTPNESPMLVHARTGARFTGDQVKPGGPEAPSLQAQVTTAVQATKQAALAKEQADLARRQAQEAQDYADRRQAYELAELRELTAQFWSRGLTVARIRVEPDQVAGIVQQLGVNTARADKQPGSDGLTTISLNYNAGASGTCARISTVLERVVAQGGQVYEMSDAQATRQRGTYSDRQRGLGYQAERSKDAGREL